MSDRKDLVILLHGILRSKTDMLPLTLFLKRHGYNALNILYPSRKKSLEDLTEYVRERAEAHPNYKDGNLHFVTHSMGGLIARYYIAAHRPANLGKVVMLAPPNTGSEFADALSDHPFLGPLYMKLFGPASLQLKTDYAHIDKSIDFPLGVIAGNFSINPLALGVLPGRHDGIVPVERTKIDGMADHIVLPVTHTFMMFNPKVMAQTLHFLEHGRFQPVSTRLQKRASSVE